MFFGTDLTGDAALAMAPGDAKPSEIEAIRRNLGLDRPVVIRYFDYLGGLFIGDFGRSYNKRQPAFDVVMERIPNTVQLAVSALIIAIVIGIPLGILSAVKRDSFLDRLGKSFAILGMSMPQFWLAIILMWIFAVELGILPTFGKDGLDPRYFIIPGVLHRRVHYGRLHAVDSFGNAGSAGQRVREIRPHQGLGRAVGNL